MTLRHQTCPTADLEPDELAAVRALMVEAFAGGADSDLDDDDWDHALGGSHVLVWDGSVAIAHGSVVCRRVLHAGRTLRCGYVEAVVVRSDRRRRGLATGVMAEVERLLGGYDLGALDATDDGGPLYEGRGWVPWRGRLSAITPSGVVGTPEDEAGGVMVWPGATALDPTAELTCDWRVGDLW